MNAPRIIPAGPMGLDDILPMIRMVGDLRERGRQREAEAEAGDCGGVAEYHAAAELEERIRQPITVAGRVLPNCDSGTMYHWQDEAVSLFASVEWHALVFIDGEVGIRSHGRGPTIAAALADAQKRYQAAIADTLLRMGGLLREVVL